MSGQLTVPRLIDFISADLDILREFWRIRRDKPKTRISFEDVKIFVSKVDVLIEFWQRLQILHGDPSDSGHRSNCLKCDLRKRCSDEPKRKEISCQTVSKSYQKKRNQDLDDDQMSIVSSSNETLENSNQKEQETDINASPNKNSEDNQSRLENNELNISQNSTVSIENEASQGFRNVFKSRKRRKLISDDFERSSVIETQLTNDKLENEVTISDNAPQPISPVLGKRNSNVPIITTVQTLSRPSESNSSAFIQSLLKEQVLLPNLEESGVVLAPSATPVLPHLETSIIENDSSPAPTLQATNDENLSVEKVCQNFGLTDVALDYSDAEYQNLTTYNIFQQAYRSRIQSANPKVPEPKLMMLLAAKWREFQTVGAKKLPKSGPEEFSQDDELMETGDSIEKTPIPSPAIRFGEGTVPTRIESEPKLATISPVEEFSLGDLAWAFGNFNGSTVYWPCVMIVDPDTYEYTRLGLGSDDNFQREYHLQFFGIKVQRAWVESSKLLKFKGLKYFNELAKKKKRTSAFKPPQSQSLRKIWDDAITSCSKMIKRSKKERLEISTKSWENRDNNKNPDQRNGPNISTVQIHSNPSESIQPKSLLLNFQPLNVSNLQILDQPSGTLTEEENNSPNAEQDSSQENISNKKSPVQRNGPNISIGKPKKIKGKFLKRKMKNSNPLESNAVIVTEEKNDSPNVEQDSVPENISNDHDLMETEDSIENIPELPAVDFGENLLDTRNQSEPKLTTDMVLIHSDTIKSETEELQQEVPDQIEPSSVVEAQLDSNSGNDHSELHCPTFDSFQIPKNGKQYFAENLSDALEEIKCGQDALVVCKKYNVPSVMLYNGMKQFILEDALKSGQSIISASEKYKTALSILEEKLKKIVAKKRYTDENLLDALKGIQNGLCVNASSEKHNVPGGTLRDWKRRLNLEPLTSNPTHKNQENVDTIENNSASKEIEDDDDDIPDFSQPITEQQTSFDPSLDSNGRKSNSESEAPISNEIQGLPLDTSPTLESGNTALTKRGKQHNWTEEDILEALNDIKNGQSINASSKKFNIPLTTLREKAKKSNIKSSFTNGRETDQSASTEPNPAPQQEIFEDHDLAETEGLSPFLNPIERTPISSPAPRYEDIDTVETSPDIKDEVLEEPETLIADVVLTHSNDIKSETEAVTATGEGSENYDSNSRKSNSDESEAPISNEIQGTSPSLESINKAPRYKGKKYTEKDMLEALNDIKNGQSIAASSKKYNIPNSTLHDRSKKMSEDCESQEITNQNAIEGLEEGDSEISFNLSSEAQKIHSSVRIDRRLADRVLYLMNNGIQVQYNHQGEVDDFKVQGSAPRSELQKKKKSKVSVQEDEEDLELGRQKLLDKFYSSNKRTISGSAPKSEPQKKKKSKVSVQEDEENLERCRQNLLDKLKSPSKSKKAKKRKRCDMKQNKQRHSMPN